MSSRNGELLLDPFDGSVGPGTNGAMIPRPIGPEEGGGSVRALQRADSLQKNEVSNVEGELHAPKTHLTNVALVMSDEPPH